MSGNNQAISTNSEKTGKRSIVPVLWLMPLAFIIHDGEELLTMPHWIANHRSELDYLASKSETAAEMIRSLPVTTKQTAIAIGVFLILFLVVTTGATILSKHGFWLYAYAALLGILFLHVFTHIAQAVIFAGYTPGLVGAVVVVIPAAIYIYKRLFEENLLTIKSAILTALIGLVLFVPGALLAQQIGQTLGSK